MICVITALVFLVIAIYLIGVVLYMLEYKTGFVDALKWPSKRIDV